MTSTSSDCGARSHDRCTCPVLARSRHRPAPERWHLMVALLLVEADDLGVPHPAAIRIASEALAVAPDTVHDRYREAVRALPRAAALGPSGRRILTDCRSLPEAMVRLREAGRTEHGAALLEALRAEPGRSLFPLLGAAEAIQAVSARAASSIPSRSTAIQGDLS